MRVPSTYLIHLKCQYRGDSRRLEREAATVNVWPPSPKAPSRSSYVVVRHFEGCFTKVYDFTRSTDTDRNRSKRSKRRRRSPSTESSEPSSEEERRRKEKRKRRSGKDRSRHKSSRKSRRQDDSEDDEKDQRRDRRRRGSTRSPQRERTKSGSVEQTPPRSPEELDDDEWVEKPATGVVMGPPPVPTVASSTAAASTTTTTRTSNQPADDDSDSEVGPQPAPVLEMRSNKRVDERQYGGALLRGEGSAMAAFLQEDPSVRIPRRGEIGLKSDEIANFEAVGYVMSGSRHKRMNAVRIRKENQVISAEEKRGILKLQKEERERREAILREEFQELVSEKLKVAESGRRPSKS